MHRRQPLPYLWMMTDERQGDALLQAVSRLPRGAGIVFRHYSLAPAERRALFGQVRAIARRRGLILMLSGPSKLAAAWGADGSHGFHHNGHDSAAPLLRSASVHDLPSRLAAERLGVDLLFLSPTFPTRSHPGARDLGPVRLGLIARSAGLPIYALGGMNPANARRLSGLNIAGWAAIDAWSV